MTRTHRKVLVPLATALAAGAVAVGSGATFSSSTSSATSFTTGTLTQSNDHDVLFAAQNLKPGDTYDGTVTIKNTGSLEQRFTLKETGANNPFGAHLQLTVTDGATQLYSGDFDKLPVTALGQGAWAAGEAHTFGFSVTLSSAADNTFQDKSAAATFTWDGTQTAGQTS